MHQARQRRTDQARSSCWQQHHRRSCMASSALCTCTPPLDGSPPSTVQLLQRLRLALLSATPLLLLLHLHDSCCCGAHGRWCGRRQLGRRPGLDADEGLGVHSLLGAARPAQARHAMPHAMPLEYLFMCLLRSGSCLVMHTSTLPPKARPSWSMHTADAAKFKPMHTSWNQPEARAASWASSAGVLHAAPPLQSLLWPTVTCDGGATAAHPPT